MDQPVGKLTFIDEAPQVPVGKLTFIDEPPQALAPVGKLTLIDEPAVSSEKPSLFSRIAESFAPPPQGLPDLMGVDVPPSEEEIAAQQQPLYRPNLNDKPTTIKQGVWESVKQAASGLSTPANIKLLAGSMAAPPVGLGIGLAYAPEMVKSSYQELLKGKVARESGLKGEAAMHYANAVVTALFASLMAKQGYKGVRDFIAKPSVAPSVTPKVKATEAPVGKLTLLPEETASNVAPEPTISPKAIVEPVPEPIAPPEVTDAATGQAVNTSRRWSPQKSPGEDIMTAARYYGLDPRDPNIADFMSATGMEKSRAGGLLRKSGVKLDTLRENLNQLGYGPFESINDMFGAFEASRTGKVRPAGYEAPESEALKLQDEKLRQEVPAEAVKIDDLALAPGDRLVTPDDAYVVKKVGNQIILKDGKILKLKPSDKLDVIGGQEGIARKNPVVEAPDVFDQAIAEKQTTLSEQAKKSPLDAMLDRIDKQLAQAAANGEHLQSGTVFYALQNKLLGKARQKLNLSDEQFASLVRPYEGQDRVALIQAHIKEIMDSSASIGEASQKVDLVTDSFINALAQKMGEGKERLPGQSDFAEQAKEAQAAENVRHQQALDQAQFARKVRPAQAPSLESETVGSNLFAKQSSLETILPELETRVAEQVGEVPAPGGLSVRRVGGMPETPKAQGFKFTDPETEARFQAAKGVKPEDLFSKIKELGRHVVRATTRGAHEFLPRGAEFEPARFELLKLDKQWGVASDKAIRIQQAITLNLDKPSYDLFSRKVILDDLAQEAAAGRDLPFGFKPDTLAAEKTRLDASISPQVAEAVQTRKTVMNAVRDDLVKAHKDIGSDIAEKMSKEDYFRHQVLEYAKAQDLLRTGGKVKSPVTRGYLKERKGSELDINSDYLQAENEVMAHMLHDTQIAKFIKFVDSKYNIQPRLAQEAKIARRNGKDVTWQEIVPEGYTTWQPREGNVFYLSNSLPESAADNIRKALMKEGGLEAKDLEMVEAILNEMKKVPVIGGPRKQFVIKQELADQLNKMPTVEGPIVKASREVQNLWKVWQLVSPRRFFKYNARNMTGDLDATFVGNPKALRQVPQAVRELWLVYKGDAPMTPEMKAWFERGGMQSNVQVQEIGDLNKLEMFQKLAASKGTVKEMPLKAWQSYWKAARISTDFREGILRYGNYLEYLKQMKANNGKPQNFGASLPEEVMALESIEDRAYKLSNELIGAYDDVSVATQTVSRHLMPFSRWLEVNFKRYVRLAKNAASTGDVSGSLARMFAIKSPVVAYKLGKFIVQATALMGMLQAWNQLKYPEEENELPENVRSKVHIVLGRDENGKVIYFNRLGALSDFLDWFGLDDAPRDVSDLLNGRRSLGEIVKEGALSPLNKLAQGLSPVYKTPAEILSKKQFFPDVTKPRPIRDMGLYLAQQYGLDAEYRSVAGLPNRGYSESLKNVVAYSVDPGEAAFQDTYEIKGRFMKSIQKGGDFQAIATPKSTAIYNYKTAIRYKDKVAAEKYLREYANLGGTRKSFDQSLASLHPLYGLNRQEQKQFMDSLSEDERIRVERAIKFYTDNFINLKEDRETLPFRGQK